MICKMLYMFALLFVSTTVGQPIFTEKIAKRLASWTEHDVQSMLEISGQTEGDMVLNEDQIGDKLRNGMLDESYLWPNKTVVYQFDFSIINLQREHVYKALEDMSAQTCLIFREREKGDTDYIHITIENGGCWSYVGRQGGMQRMNLQSVGCLHLRFIQHEFLHALGFFHMHNSPDRDDYVKINWENIQPGAEGNFTKLNSNVSSHYGFKYDYKSLTHLGAYAFSSEDRRGATITPLESGIQIGAASKMSETDVAKVNKLYNCN